MLNIEAELWGVVLGHFLSELGVQSLTRHAAFFTII